MAYLAIAAALMILVVIGVGYDLRHRSIRKRKEWMARPILGDEGWKALQEQLRGHIGREAVDVTVNALRTSRLSKTQADYVIAKCAFEAFTFADDRAKSLLYYNELLAEHVALAEERGIDERLAE